MTGSQLSPLGRFDKVLICTDGSDFSAGAVRVGVALAQKSGARAIAMSMVRTNPEYEALAPQLVAEAGAQARGNVAVVQAEAEAAGVACTPLVVSGDDPPHEIIARAASLDVDLVVMGRRGRRGLARLMVGDATAKVAGLAKCSVLVVPQAAAMWHGRVLLATDGSRCSDAAAVAALAVARCCAVPVTVVGALVPSHNAARLQEGREAVARTVELLRNEGIDVEGIECAGEADEVIITTCRDRAADLIIVGSHGRTGLGKVLIGSVSERVIGKAACAVMVVKA
jgi:nucleotide-binding universal stress UspA family protein